MSNTFNVSSAELSARSIILTCASVLSVAAATLISRVPCAAAHTGYAADGTTTP